MKSHKTNTDSIHSKQSLFFAIGLCLTLILVIAAFEWKTKQKPVAQLEVIDILDEVMPEIKNTIQEPPKPPKVIAPKIIEITEEIKIEDPPDFTFDAEEIEDIILNQPLQIEEEPTDEIVLFPEKAPEPNGGMRAFYTYIAKEMRYPKFERRAGIEGRVTVQFVVGKDGSLTDIVILRGLSEGCDNEALRVLQNAPKWSPGKQRGRPVRVRMALPITFKLN